MNSQMPGYAPNMFYPNFQNPNEQLRALEGRVNSLEREVRRLENRLNRLEQNMAQPYGTNTGAKYRPDSYNMF